jgi:starch synthase (maltosyl-transferring)
VLVARASFLPIFAPVMESPARPAHAPTCVIENFFPDLGAENYLIKRVIGEPLDVFADIFTDGHVILLAVLKWRPAGSNRWYEANMKALENDRFTGQCSFPKAGRWEYVVEAWADEWLTWKKHFKAKYDANDPELGIEAREGARLLEGAAQRARAAGAADTAVEITQLAEMLRVLPASELIEILLAPALQAILDRHQDRSLSTISRGFRVIVERERARFSAWYEFFPRSAEGRGDKHSSFRDCLPRLDDAKDMGFNVIYFPPIHPIGVSNRKGKNNTLKAYPGDVGSPWAIGSAEGGHRAIEPALGTMEDFQWLLQEARNRGLEIALDFAINCSPDHPYVAEHPEWFYQREDGTIRYAENPPKKYQDIYPLNFHNPNWKALWRELIDVVLFWVGHGVKIFRVDNPHTKPVAFWETLIAEVQARDPEVIFLAEAFTKPRMMQALGKIGFSQSYTYFTWREERQGLTEYATELSAGEMKHYYRGNFWPNTPDILPFPLQNAPASAFKIRAALAALLMPSWGMYSGYEFCEGKPLPGREEYLDSEKFQLAWRDWNSPNNIKGFIREVNRARNENRALQLYDNLRFHNPEHPDVIAFSKATPDWSNRTLAIININPHNAVSTMVHLDMAALGLPHDRPYQVHDVLHGNSYTWQGNTNFVHLDPNATFMHLFRVEV